MVLGYTDHRSPVLESVSSFRECAAQFPGGKRTRLCGHDSLQVMARKIPFANQTSPEGYKGPEMPPSFLIFQKCHAIRPTIAAGNRKTCHT